MGSQYLASGPQEVCALCGKEIPKGTPRWYNPARPQQFEHPNCAEYEDDAVLTAKVEEGRKAPTLFD